MEDGIGVMRAENESSLQVLDKLSAFDLVCHATCFEKASSSFLRGLVILQGSLFMLFPVHPYVEVCIWWVDHIGQV